MDSSAEKNEGIEVELLRRFLAGRDVPCPRCEYNLRDLHGDHCPECGDGLIIRVNMAEPRLAALICGLVGLSAGAGLNGLLLVYGAAMMLFTGRGSNSWQQFFYCNGIGFTVTVLMLLLWLRNWRRIRRLPSGTQWRWAIACWLLTAGNLVYFTLNVK
jgi:hypothetical protein